MYADETKIARANMAYAQQETASLDKIGDRFTPTLGNSNAFAMNIRDSLASTADKLEGIANALFGEEPQCPSAGSKPLPYYSGALGELQERLDTLMELAYRLDRLAQRLSTVL